jgi:hypothetical protein
MSDGRFESFTGADWAKQHGNGQARPEVDGEDIKRQHWLYDAKKQPETTGTATTRQPCKSERVRVSRGDGTTTVTRIDKCQ